MQDDMVLNCCSSVVKNVNLSDVKALGVAAWLIVQVWGQTCWCQNTKPCKIHENTCFGVFLSILMCFNFRHLPAIDSCPCQRKMIWYWIVIHALSRMWTCQMPKHLAWLLGVLYKYGAKHVGAETMWNTWKNVFWHFLVYFDVFQLQTSTSNW